MSTHATPSAIKITSKLNPSNAKALHRWSARMFDTQPEALAALNVGRSLWVPMIEDAARFGYEYDDARRTAINYLHAIARRMMTAAGTTFRYELVTR